MKVVALANAHALAHVSRLLEIAKVLRSHGHEITFAGRGKYLQVASQDGFNTRELPYISAEQIVRAVRTQKLWELYRRAELEVFIEAELELYRELQPDLVLIDNRPTARTSAEIAGLKTAAVLNVHMSNHKQIPFFSLSHRFNSSAIPGLGLLDRLGNAGECAVYDRVVMGDLNKIRHDHGLKRLYAYEHEEGDIALFADVPEFNPVRKLPENAHYVGPLTWHNSLSAPACLEQLDASKPTLYFSLGSEGLGELIEHLGILTNSGVQIVVATGTDDIQHENTVPQGVFLEQYVNTELLLPHCDLVCCHGGNGTIYQALSFGLPLVVVATHQEQNYGGKRIQRLGLGKALTLKRLKKAGMEHLVRMVATVLDDTGYRTRAEKFARYLVAGDSAKLGARLIEQFDTGMREG